MPDTSRPPLLAVPVRRACQALRSRAATPLGLLPALVQRQPDLLPRMAVYATHLRALPRRVRRLLQRQWRLSLVGIALLLALGQPPSLAATIPVSVDCMLVDAITAANTDTATGGCPAGSDADTIVLPPGSTQTLTEVNNSTYGPTGLPIISSVVTLEGQGSIITRQESYTETSRFRIIAVNSTGNLTLNETTVSGGRFPFSYDDRFNGGGIANYGGTLTVLNSTITGNGTSRYYGAGGGVANVGGTLAVLNSTITGNSATRYGGAGGGVANLGGTLTMLNSIIVNNFSGDGYVGSGGGVANVDGTLTMLNSIIANNYASGEMGRGGRGGGVFNLLGQIPRSLLRLLPGCYCRVHERLST